MSADSKIEKKEKHYLTLVTGIVIALIFLFYMFSFTVPYGQVAVLTFFGKPAKPITQPGLYFKIPLVHKVHKYDARPQVSEDVPEETTTKDKMDIIVEAYIIWNINDPLKFLKTLGTLEEAESNLRDIVRTKKTAVFGRHQLNELVSVNPEELKYDEIENEMLQQLKKSEISNWGIDVSYVGIKRLALPEKITEKVFARMKAERKRLEDDLLSQGQSEAEKITALAGEEEQLILAAAESAAKQIRAEGVREAAEYYKVFQANPQLANFLKRIEALKELLKEGSTVIIDTSAPPMDLLEGKPEISQ